MSGIPLSQIVFQRKAYELDYILMSHVCSSGWPGKLMTPTKGTTTGGGENGEEKRQRPFYRKKKFQEAFLEKKKISKGLAEEKKILKGLPEEKKKKDISP